MLLLRRLPALTRARPTTTLRTLTTTPARAADFNRPGPPPLPPAEQAEFEALVKAAQTADSATAAAFDVEPTAENLARAQKEAGEHRDLRKGAEPEFTGDTNPKTGEVGGPKRDPFVAGNADWQFGGRVTDF